MALWTFDDLVVASQAVLDGQPVHDITGFSIDTRSLASGEIFVALTDARDGHDFVAAAFERGASAALVRADYVRGPSDGALLRVDDPLRALERIGASARARLSPTARVIAVTGSAGKTGTKEMLRACLSPLGQTHAPVKSFNNHWGVPLTLARMPADTQFAVIEIGMNHAGEIAPLTMLTRPHIAVITNVLPVHVGNFADGEIGVANAKAEILQGLSAGSGVAILPRDNPHYERLAAAATARDVQIVSFGLKPNADVCAVDHDLRGDGSDVFIPEGRYALGMLGLHQVVNSLTVVATLREIAPGEANVEERLRLLDRLGDLRPPAGRGARERIALSAGEFELLDESYNANPASMRAALDILARANPGPSGRRIAMLGDMRELGADSQAYHLALAVPIAEAGVDLVFACGPFMRTLFDHLPQGRRGVWAETSSALVAHAVGAIRPGDVVMIKGSLGTNMAPLILAVRALAASA